jgi:hypothetical protein
MKSKKIVIVMCVLFNFGFVSCKEKGNDGYENKIDAQIRFMIDNEKNDVIKRKMEIAMNDRVVSEIIDDCCDYDDIESGDVDVVAFMLFHRIREELDHHGELFDDETLEYRDVFITEEGRLSVAAFYEAANLLGVIEDEKFVKLKERKVVDEGNVIEQQLRYLVNDLADPDMRRKMEIAIDNGLVGTLVAFEDLTLASQDAAAFEIFSKLREGLSDIEWELSGDKKELIYGKGKKVRRYKAKAPLENVGYPKEETKRNMAL